MFASPKNILNQFDFCLLMPCILNYEKFNTHTHTHTRTFWALHELRPPFLSHDVYSVSGVTLTLVFWFRGTPACDVKSSDARLDEDWFMPRGATKQTESNMADPSNVSAAMDISSEFGSGMLHSSDLDHIGCGGGEGNFLGRLFLCWSLSFCVVFVQEKQCCDVLSFWQISWQPASVSVFICSITFSLIFLTKLSKFSLSGHKWIFV